MAPTIVGRWWLNGRVDSCRRVVDSNPALDAT